MGKMRKAFARVVVGLLAMMILATSAAAIPLTLEGQEATIGAKTCLSTFEVESRGRGASSCVCPDAPSFLKQVAALHEQDPKYQVEILDENARWKIVAAVYRDAIQDTGECDAWSIVLALLKPTNTWFALLRPEGSTRRPGDVPRMGLVGDDVLRAWLCVESYDWGRYGLFAIDLRAMTLTNLAPGKTLFGAYVFETSPLQEPETIFGRTR